jgi:hypothetical protein
MKFGILYIFFFENVSRQLKFRCNPTRITGISREDKYTLFIISRGFFLRMRNASDEIFDNISLNSS